MPPATGAKRSLFSKPAWAAKDTPKSPDDGASIFGQHSVYEDIVAAEQERRERHAARIKQRAEKDRIKNERQAAQVSESKRRRISKEASEDESDSDARSSIGGGENRQEELRSRRTTPQNNKPVLRSAPTVEKEAYVPGESVPKLRPRTQSKNTPKTIEEEDDDLVIVGASHKSAKLETTTNGNKSEPQVDPESEEDEYLRELKQKARREAKLQKSRNGQSKETTPAVQSPSINNLASPQAQPDSAQSISSSTTTPTDDHKVHIHIKTIIPNARPLLITRHASQPLDFVREFWCQRNELAPAIASRVFFTWNGTKLYDSTTMRGIIERLKKLRPMPDGSDPSEGRIEIEAVTDEIFEYQQKQNERRRQEKAGLLDPLVSEHDSQGGGEADGTPINETEHETPAAQQQQPPAPTEKPGIVIKLTSPDHASIDLRVRPNSSMAKIVTMYRRVHNISADRECWLIFDGEKLEPTQTVEEAEFEHEDTVEVHFK